MRRGKLCYSICIWFVQGESSESSEVYEALSIPRFVGSLSLNSGSFVGSHRSPSRFFCKALASDKFLTYRLERAVEKQIEVTLFLTPPNHLDSFWCTPNVFKNLHCKYINPHLIFISLSFTKIFARPAHNFAWLLDFELFAFGYNLGCRQMMAQHDLDSPNGWQLELTCALVCNIAFFK